MIIIVDDTTIYSYSYPISFDDVVDYKTTQGSFSFYFDALKQEICFKADSCFTMLQQQPITDLSNWKLKVNDTLITIFFIDELHYKQQLNGYLWEENTVEIGDTPNAKIKFNTSLFNGYKALLSKDEGMIYADCIANDSGQSKRIQFIQGQGYVLFGISIIWVNNQLFIQESDLLTINLERMHQNLLGATPFNIIVKDTYHNLQNTYKPNTLQQQLPTLPTIPVHIQTPLWVSMGHMLIMGIATLTSSSIMAIQRYYNGQDLIDSLPSLILPMMLIISTILFQPCIRNFEKKRQKQESLQRFNQFNHQFSALTMVGYEALANLSNYIEKYFPTSMSMIQTFDHAKLNIYDLSNDELSISLGKSNIESNFVIEGADQFVDDPAIASSLKEYTDKLQSLYTMMPFMIESNKRYALIDIDDNLYKNIMVQLLSRYSKDQLQLIFIVNHSFLALHQELFILPYCYDNEKWLVLEKGKEIPENDTTKKRIIFSQYPLDQTIDLPIFYLGLVQGVVDATIAMDESGCAYYDYSQRKVKIDMDDLTKMDLSSHMFYWFAQDSAYQQNYSLLTINGYNEFNVEHLYQKYALNEYTDNLESSFAINEQGVFRLDISEKKDGPHGLCCGGTGSGKSELVLTFLVSLFLNYSPTKLQLVIIDFKGSSLALALKQFPHFVGSIDNLSLHECQRFIAALKKQSSYRQNLFKQASNESSSIISDIQAYRLFAKDNPSYPQLAHLIIMVDEFAQVKKLAYDFVEEIIQLARIGRSLGIHLLLSTQKPSGVINDQILANTRYKICLKVNERNDSMDVINSPLALSLKNPGSFYCLSDNGLVKAQSIYVKDYDDPNHINHKGMIKDITGKKSGSYEKLHTSQTILESIVNVLQHVNVHPLPLIPKAVSVYQKEQSNTNLIEIGKYDDLENVEQRISSIKWQSNNTLVIGNSAIVEKMQNTIALYLQKYKSEQCVIVINQNGCNYASLSLTFNNLEQIEECLIGLSSINTEMSLIIDERSGILEENQRLTQLIKKVKTNKYIHTFMFLPSISPYVYRSFGSFDSLFIDSLLDTTQKSLFFPLVSKVSEGDSNYIYDQNGNYIALNIYDQYIKPFKESGLYLSNESFALSKSCYARYLFSGERIGFNNCFISAYNPVFLSKISKVMESMGYPIVHDINKTGIHFITMEQCQEIEQLKTCYYDAPLFFVGPGVKQQYVFPLQQYKEHDYKKAYMLNGCEIKEVRWFDL